MSPASEGRWMLVVGAVAAPIGAVLWLTTRGGDEAATLATIDDRAAVLLFAGAVLVLAGVLARR